MKLQKLLLATVASISAISLNQAPTLAANVCQCTDYVANRLGLARNYGHAGDWDNGYLQRNGFVRVNGPVRGAVAVMERSFPGSDRNFGHVGIVENVLRNGRIELRGGNQWVGSPLFTENNCRNVRLTVFGTPVNGRSDISFWVRR